MRPESSQRLIRLAARAWTLMFGCYFLWEAVSYQGVFARLAEFQIARFGYYVPLLTYLLLLCLCTIPVWIVARLLLRNATKDLPLVRVFELRLAQARRLRRLLIALSTTAIGVAAGFLIFSLFALPDQEGELETITASELGTVALKEGPARLVGGELGTMIFFGQDWFVGDDRMAFAPYRSASSNDGLVHVFVQLKAGTKSDAEKITQRPAWSGIMVEGGLPGPVRVLFNDIEVGIASEHYTLYQSEYALKIRYWLQAIQWTILGLFLAITVAFQSRSIRKLEGRRDDVAS